MRIISSITGIMSRIFTPRSLIVLCILTAITVSGCMRDDAAENKKIPNESSDNELFRIYTGDTEEDHFNYYYDIFDLSGNVIKHECTYMEEPEITVVDGNILKISVQAGTGKSTVCTYYCDVENNTVSPTYYYVLCESAELVAYFNEGKVIVSGMFDNEEYYKEIRPGKELAASADPIVSAEFSDDLSSITVTYLHGDNSDEITETVSLRLIPDDSITLSETVTNEYSLSELTAFFGEVSQNEAMAFEDSNSVNLTISKVNEKFPIECLRKNGYSVYKVKDGGYFYVFLAKSFDPLSDSGSSDDAVYFTAYLTDLKKESDFDSIKPGKSTAEDVAEIDPAFELIFLLSSKTPSYSLLEDGTVMEICYTFDDSCSSRRDLLVKSKKVITKEDCPSRLASILSKDLPSA